MLVWGGGVMTKLIVLNKTLWFFVMREDILSALQSSLLPDIWSDGILRGLKNVILIKFVFHLRVAFLQYLLSAHVVS